MAAKKPGTTPTFATELSDIPLSLEQDVCSLNAAQAQKSKTNSLKRFFRKTKIPAKEDIDATPKDVQSQQLRFGTFRKNDDSNNDITPGSSKEVVTESRQNLPDRLYSCWNSVFKRSKKTSNPVANEGNAATTEEN